MLIYIIAGISLVFGFLLSFGIGANDVANTFGTVVGSKTLSLRSAVIIASIMECAGALLAGARVTETVRKGIFDPNDFVGEPILLAALMMSSLFASSLWLIISSLLTLPVSGTHAMIGSLVGGAVSTVGWAKVDKSTLYTILLSMVSSPVFAGILAAILMKFNNSFILVSKNPASVGKFFITVLMGFIIGSNVFLIVYGGSETLGLDDTPLLIALIITLIATIFTMILVYLISNSKLSGFIERKKEEDIDKDKHIIDQPLIPIPHLKSNSFLGKPLDASFIYTTKDQYQNLLEGAKEYNSTAERVFEPLQIVIAVFGAYSHGTNSFSNILGPLGAVFMVLKTGGISSESVESNFGFFILASIGLVTGLATIGYKVISTMGERLTKISQSRSFAIEFASAYSAIIASRIGIPISTTHSEIGAVTFCAWVSANNNAKDALNISLLKNILVSWIVTLPFCALVSYIITSLFWFIIVKN